MLVIESGYRVLSLTFTDAYFVNDAPSQVVL